MGAANLRVIREGRDPIAEKRQAAEELRRLPTPTFAHAAHSVIALRRPTWSNAKHAAQWENTLATYVHPALGKKLASDITSADVLTVLTPIWTTKSETASRVRQRIETLLGWAIAQGYRYDNPAGKAIPKVLPRQPRVKARRDHRVPLSERALAILTRAQDLRVEGGDLVFPGRGERPLSDMVHTTMPQRLGIPAVSHGFRSSFKDWSNPGHGRFHDWVSELFECIRCDGPNGDAGQKDWVTGYGHIP